MSLAIVADRFDGLANNLWRACGISAAPYDADIVVSIFSAAMMLSSRRSCGRAEPGSSFQSRPCASKVGLARLDSGAHRLSHQAICNSGPIARSAPSSARHQKVLNELPSRRPRAFLGELAACLALTNDLAAVNVHSS